MLLLRNSAAVPDAALPGAGHYTALRSTTLERLFSAVSSAAAGGTLQFAGLPALRCLSLDSLATRSDPF